MSTQVISFNCVLKNKSGHLISSTFNRDVLTSSPEKSSMLEGLAKGLQNLAKGEKRCIALKAEEAYGLYIPQKIILFPRKKLPSTVKSGQFISIVGKSGQVRPYKVVDFQGDMVTLDGNHPLAGQDLVFEIETLAVRDATVEEVTSSVNVISTQILH